MKISTFCAHHAGKAVSPAMQALMEAFLGEE
ncbi:hypothetical protein STW0522KLE44_38520 [Klebsiella sp. STW0522-44]|nr:hypothetical protein STW0522KLE44_38520 [Klebsiella sp. STW0522-44]